VDVTITSGTPSFELVPHGNDLNPNVRTIQAKVELILGPDYPAGAIRVLLNGCEPDPEVIAEAILRVVELGRQVTIFDAYKE
jgi:beta-glucosidase-like glycosyl hydrolase